MDISTKEEISKAISSLLKRRDMYKYRIVEYDDVVQQVIEEFHYSPVDKQNIHQAMVDYLDEILEGYSAHGWDPERNDQMQLIVFK